MRDRTANTYFKKENEMSEARHTILLKECDAAYMNEEHSVLLTRPIVMQNIALVKCVGLMHRPEMVFICDQPQLHVHSTKLCFNYFEGPHSGCSIDEGEFCEENIKSFIRSCSEEAISQLRIIKNLVQCGLDLQKN